MLAQLSPEVQRNQNLAAITECVAPVRDDTELSIGVAGEFQGIFVRRTGDLVELYCYDTATQERSCLMPSMDVARPLKLICPYSQAMFLAVFWLEAAPRDVYLAGLGGGAIALVLQHYFGDCRFDGSDIDPNIILAAPK